GPDPDGRAHVVQRGPARWQPGADRADGLRPQDAAVPTAPEDWLQGDRDWISVGLSDRLQLHAGVDRGRADSRGRYGPGAHPGACRPHHANLREPAWRAPRDRAPL